MSGTKGHLHVGTSGYQYDHWRGRFYPPNLSKREWFAHYASEFDTVEINNTFYRLPELSVFKEWESAAPSGFTYALKYSRFGSHRKHLKDPDQHVPHMIERARTLKKKLGPILVQLPPRWNVNVERLDEFLKALPRTIRWALEFRDESWLNEEVFKLLRKKKCAMCIHDAIKNHPREITAPWTYVRFHGNGYAKNYSKTELRRWSEQVGAWIADGLDVYVYFNNDLKGHAVTNAQTLRDLV